MTEYTQEMAVEKMSLSRKLVSGLGIALCLLFGFLLICNLVIIVKGTLYPDRPPSVFGTTPMAVLSGSMSGTEAGHIEIGDLIFVAKIEPEELKAGDVIAYMDGKIIVTHRIQEVQTAADGSIQWITKGDANNGADPDPIPEEDLVGIYKMRIPKLGDFALFMQTPLGMVLFVGLPLMAFILYDVIRRQRYANQEKQKTEEMQAEIERLRSLAAQQEKAIEEKQPSL